MVAAQMVARVGDSRQWGLMDTLFITIPADLAVLLEPEMLEASESARFLIHAALGWRWIASG